MDTIPLHACSFQIIYSGNMTSYRLSSVVLVIHFVISESESDCVTMHVHMTSHTKLFVIKRDVLFSFQTEHRDKEVPLYFGATGSDGGMSLS